MKKKKKYIISHNGQMDTARWFGKGNKEYWDDLEEAEETCKRANAYLRNLTRNKGALPLGVCEVPDWP